MKLSLFKGETVEEETVNVNYNSTFTGYGSIILNCRYPRAKKNKWDS